LKSYDGKKQVVQRAEGYRIVHNKIVVIRGRDKLHQYLKSYDGKKQVVQRAEGYRIVHNKIVVIRGRDKLHPDCVFIVGWLMPFVVN